MSDNDTTVDENITEEYTSIPEDEVRTLLAYAAQSYAKQTKSVNDGLVSVLNQDVALNARTTAEFELAQDAYLQTKKAVESLTELSESLDETDEDEPSVAQRFNPVVSETDTTEVSRTQTATSSDPTVEEQE